MGLFSRRILYRMLTENRQFISADKVRHQVNQLNGGGIVERLTTEWEVAVLNSFSKFGHVQFEPELAGGVAIDFLFTRGKHILLIEISTVSDRGLDEMNPVSQLCDELVQRVRKSGLGLNPSKFAVHVDGNWRDLYLGGPKAHLYLPDPNEFGSVIFNERFTEFLNKIGPVQTNTSLHIPLNGDAGVTITYNPAQEFFTYSHLSYTVPFQVRSNPIYNRLHAKANQLRNAGFEGIKGIILCDAGCTMLNQQGLRGQRLGADDIIDAFLDENPSIGFVIVLSVASDDTRSLGPNHLKIAGRLYRRAVNSEVASLFDDLCQQLAGNLPRPETTPVNALSLSNEGRSFSGGGTVSATKIKMSARTAVALLAGQITTEEFTRDNKFFSDHFARMIGQGRMLTEVRIERTERDDDWIEFIFSDPDPAISPFDASR